MDFGEILSRWESRQEQDKRKAGRKERHAESANGPEGGGPKRRRTELRFEELLDRFPPIPEESESTPDDAAERPAGRRALQRMAPQARLDLHGMNSREAEAAIRGFLIDCRKRGLRKVLIIHGKGNHSAGEPVLGRTVRRVLERNPLAGEFGAADRSLGGKGALWVILR